MPITEYKVGDTFFTQKDCDRCGGGFKSTRIMSWFTDETICMSCAYKERELRNNLPDCGKDFEGIGYIPKVNDKGVAMK